MGFDASVAVRRRRGVVFVMVMVVQALCLPLGRLTRVLDAIPALDHIRLQADGAGSAVQLEEQTTSIAKYRASLIPSPEGCCRGPAVLTDWWGVSLTSRAGAG